MTRRSDTGRRQLAERDLPGIGKAFVRSLLAPVLATHADRIARGFGPNQSPDVIRTGGTS